MISHVYRRRVRYRECDPMSVAYHTFYLDYFEEARTEALRELGIPYKSLEEQGIIMPVVNASVEYKAPAYYDDVLEIETIFKTVPNVRVPIHYEIRREGKKSVLATGCVTLCFVDFERNRPIPAPEQVQELFEAAWINA